MNSRDLVINTLNHEPVDRVPRYWQPSPEVESVQADEVAEINVRFPSDIVLADFKYPAGKRGKGKPGRPGQYTDAWGCTWRVSQPYTCGELVESPLADAQQIADYAPPLELLDDIRHNPARLDAVNRQCTGTSRFVLAATETRPFDRLCFLRGADAAAADLRRGSAGTRNLLAAIHDYFCREMQMWSETDVDAVIIRDNLCAADNSLIDSATWRSTFKPLYREYCRIIHEKDKFVFFCCEGTVGSLFGELVRVGIDAVESRFTAQDIERLAKRYRGQTTFCAGIGHRGDMASGSLEEIRESVLQIRRALDFGSGGLIASCPWQAGVPIRNICTVLEQWQAPLPMHAA